MTHTADTLRNTDSTNDPTSMRVAKAYVVQWAMARAENAMPSASHEEHLMHAAGELRAIADEIIQSATNLELCGVGHPGSGAGGGDAPAPTVSELIKRFTDRAGDGDGAATS